MGVKFMLEVLVARPQLTVSLSTDAQARTPSAVETPEEARGPHTRPLSMQYCVHTVSGTLLSLSAAA